MEKVKEAICKTLRDDNVATIGIRALLGHASTPYGVYHHHLPDAPNFASYKYITYYQISSVADLDFPSYTTPIEETYVITAWGSNYGAVISRIKFLLDDGVKRGKVTKPTSGADIYKIRVESDGPELYDEDFRVQYKSIRVKVWTRDDTITA